MTPEPRLWVRDAQPDDAPLLLPVLRQVLEESRFMLLEPDEFRTSESSLASRLAADADKSQRKLLVVECDGVLCGYLGMSGHTTRRIRHIAEIYLAVLRSHWGRGAGQALIDAAIQRAQAAGLSRVELWVDTQNSRGIALYERCGFEIEGCRRRAMRIDGEWRDDYLMGRLLGGD